jgi:Tol biopolymer transport system component
MHISKLTENGAASNGAISPDGRYLAYFKRGEHPSLWMKQIATGSEAQVVPPGTGNFRYRPTFSPDGNYIFYQHSDPENEDETLLYSVPSLGGTPQHSRRRWNRHQLFTRRQAVRLCPPRCRGEKLGDCVC